uniref:Uncharacterized protein n=1 Tax=Glossina austeni TaxID=7395 RepID=A0A1A9VHW5_GLOAU
MNHGEIHKYPPRHDGTSEILSESEIQDGLVSLMCSNLEISANKNYAVFVRYEMGAMKRPYLGREQTDNLEGTENTATAGEKRSVGKGEDGTTISNAIVMQFMQKMQQMQQVQQQIQ